MGWDWMVSSMPYGEPWRERRKIFTQHFHPNNLQSHRLVIIGFMRDMLRELLDTPDKFMEISR